MKIKDFSLRNMTVKTIKILPLIKQNNKNIPFIRCFSIPVNYWNN